VSVCVCVGGGACMQGRENNRQVDGHHTVKLSHSAPSFYQTRYIFVFLSIYQYSSAVNCLH